MSSKVTNQNVAIAGAVVVTALAGRFVWKRMKNRKAKQ
jgi:hypothetical protein